MAPRSDEPRLPTFVVVGAPKCGTTSLWHYLAQHPEVFVPERKELHYFSHERLRENSAGPGDAHALGAACATREEYAAHYRGAAGFRAVGDVSPSYLYYHAVAQRIRDELGGPGIVVMLRNPVEKAFSHYMHLVRDNREPLSFADALDAEPERTRQRWAALWRYVGGSLYTESVATYRRVFGAGRVLVVLQEELRADPAGVLARLFEFIGVDPGFRPDTSTTYHRSGKPRSRLLADLISKPGPASRLARTLLPDRVRERVRTALQSLNTGAKGALDEATRVRLRAAFLEDALALERLLGRPLPWTEELRA